MYSRTGAVHTVNEGSMGSTKGNRGSAFKGVKDQKEEYGLGKGNLGYTAGF